MSKGTFVPHQLFSSGAQGAWYDPSDFSTLYQTSTGTTPVTAVEQPVGLMLDRSRGLVLGSELIPTLDLNTGWTTAGTTTIDSANSFTTSGAGGVFFALEANKFYAVSASFSSTTTVTVRSNQPGGTNTIFLTGNGTCILGTTATETTIYIRNNASATTTISSLSVRELPGNHALQANAASRPILRARYNLLTYSEEFDNGAWAKNNITYNVGKLTEDATTNTHNVRQTFSVISGQTLSFATTISGGERNVVLRLRDHLNTGREAFAIFNPATGATVSTGGTTWTAIATSVSLGGGAYRVTMTTTVNVTGTIAADVLLADGTTLTYAGDGISGAFVNFASLLTAADAAATGGAYQRVGAATDYDVSNPVFRPYLAFDGSDDSMATSSVDFSGTDKMTVFAGVTKLSDTSFAVLTELSADLNSNNGAFTITAPSGSGTPTFGAVSKGTTSGSATYNNAAVAAPVSAALSMLSDISGDSAKLRINGSQVAQSVADQGTGNYGNYPLFIGRRNNTSSPFNGRLYSLAVLGRTATAAELGAMEAWVAGKTGVTL